MTQPAPKFFRTVAWMLIASVVFFLGVGALVFLLPEDVLGYDERTRYLVGGAMFFVAITDAIIAGVFWIKSR